TTAPAITPGPRGPVSTSQSSTDSAPVGSTPSRLAANPATVATSTLCPGDGSKVTGNLTGYPRYDSGSSRSSNRLICGTASRSASSTSSVSRHPQSWSRLSASSRPSTSDPEPSRPAAYHSRGMAWASNGATTSAWNRRERSPPLKTPSVTSPEDQRRSGSRQPFQRRPPGPRH